MKRIFLVLYYIILSSSIYAQEPVLNIDNQSVTLEEFKSIFYKNNIDVKLSKEYLDDYMELFINFKLKVREAEDLGFDTLSTFLTELDGYKKQLAKPYLRDEQFNQKMVKEAYDRMQFDINASHILLALDENADQKDTLAVYNKILNIRDQVEEGSISFNDAARKYSSDKSALDNGGNLGYFTVFMMVYPFETAAYETEVGSISDPIRTKYGYHLIKVNDKREAVGEVEVAHIMFKTGKGADVNKIKQAKQKIDQVYELLVSGDEFSDLAERFSEDRTTAVKGGVLPAFGVGKMVPEFENVAFSLSKEADYSAPFRTDYGWHIVSLISKKDIANIEDSRTDIKKKIERDSRNKLTEKALINKLKKEYSITLHNSSKGVSRIKQIERYASNNIIAGDWDGKNAKGLVYTLFEIDSHSTNQQEFIEYLVRYQYKGSSFNGLYESFLAKKLIEHEETQLSFKYPDYKALLQEYRDGILLFDLTNKKVWSKAVEDTIGLQVFYNANRESYLWNRRVDATIYTCINLETARKVKRLLYKKTRGLISDSDIINRVNTQSPLDLQLKSGEFEEGDNTYIDALEWKKGISKDIKQEDGSIIIVDIKEILMPSPKLLKETKGKVISDYQNELERQWITDLRAKYRYSVNKEILYSILK